MPTLAYSETIKTTLALAVQLHDAFSGAATLLGDVRVLVADAETGERKPLESTFIFRSLGAGAHTVEVRSLESPPLYLPVDLSITLPPADPLWPAFPDRSLADLTLPFSSPLQPVLFRTQYLATGLVPSTAYPFPGNATLIRGTVTSAGGPLSQATVLVNGERSYETGEDGEYVVFVTPYQPSVTLTFQRPGFTDSVVGVAVQAQHTTIANTFMTP